MSVALASARDASPKSRTTSTRSATPFCRAVASAEATAPADWSLATTETSGCRRASQAAMTPVPQAKSITSPSPWMLAESSCSSEEPGADVDRRAGEDATERAHRQRRGQPRQLVLLRPRLRVVPGERMTGDDHPRLLPRVRHVEHVEGAAEHIVHPERHVLDPAPGEDDDLRVGMRGDEGRDVLQSVQCSRQPEQHDPCAGDELRTESERPERALQFEAACVLLESPLAGERILMHTDAGGSGIRSAEGQRTVRVADHDESAGGCRRACRGGLVEDQPVGGIDGEELVGFEIGPAPQGVGGVGGHVHSLAQGPGRGPASGAPPVQSEASRVCLWRCVATQLRPNRPDEGGRGVLEPVGPQELPVAEPCYARTRAAARLRPGAPRRCGRARAATSPSSRAAR